MRHMSQRWIATAAVVTALGLTGCHPSNNQNQNGGGGGQAASSNATDKGHIQDQTKHNINQGASGRAAGANTAGGASGSVTAYGGQTSYDNSNPVSREEANKHAAVMREVPKQGAVTNNTPGRIQNAQSQRITQNGQVVQKVDVNHASAEQLAKVPGVSKNLAMDIVAHRPYANEKDLVKKVPNLNSTYANAITPYLSFGGGAGTGIKPTTRSVNTGTGTAAEKQHKATGTMSH